MNGKPTHMGLGAWPVISLATARDKAIENARTVTLGHDPRGGIPQIPTFAKAAKIVIGIHAEGWKDGGKSENQWRVMYNHERPHSKLGYRTPEEFAETQEQEGKKQADVSQKFAEPLA